MKPDSSINAARRNRQPSLFDAPRPKKPPQASPLENGNAASAAAARRVRSRANSQARRVYAAIVAARSRGMTDRELEASLFLPGNSVRPRRVWLQQQGYIEPLRTADSATVLRDRYTVYVATSNSWPSS